MDLRARQSGPQACTAGLRPGIFLRVMRFFDAWLRNFRVTGVPGTLYAVGRENPGIRARGAPVT